MSLLQSFVLPISGLSDGSHEYEFKLGQQFFKDFENSQISVCDINVFVALEKKPTVLAFDFTIKGSFKADCDRCLVGIDIPINEFFSLFVKYSETESQDIEVVHISPDEEEFDLSPHIYEFTHLALPTSKTRDCESENYKFCDHKALDRLEQVDVEEQEVEKTGKLWEQLKDIKLDN